MSNTKSFYLPDDVLEAIAQAGNGSAYITELVRRDTHRRREIALRNDAGTTDADRGAARAWAREQVATMKTQPADYSRLREALGIPKAS
jgi:hypothetical protein